MLSKTDKGKHITLDYERDVSGIINTGIDSTEWEFLIDYPTSYTTQTFGYSLHGPMLSGYLKTANDSLFMKTDFSATGQIILKNAQGEYLAALKHQKPLYVWIRTGIKNSYRKAIAAFFSVIIGIKDL